MYVQQLYEQVEELSKQRFENFMNRGSSSMARGTFNADSHV